MDVAETFARASDPRKTARASRSQSQPLFLRRKHSLIRQSCDRAHPCGLSTDRYTYGAFDDFVTEPATDSTYGRISFMLSRAGGAQGDRRRLFADRDACDCRCRE